jgi:hypothetical protein
MVRTIAVSRRNGSRRYRASVAGLILDVITEIPPSEEFSDSMLTTVALLAAFAAPAYAHHGTEPPGSSNAAPAAD